MSRTSGGESDPPGLPAVMVAPAYVGRATATRLIEVIEAGASRTVG